MFQPKAKIIADSINESGDRLTTFVLTYHRMIHSEFMTHRMLSKNSSSSRAIPVEKMIDKVLADDVYPLHWGKNQKGMSADIEVTPEEIESAKIIWREARMEAINHAYQLVKFGIHKQVANRLLEPFSSITVICSGTEYQNFFDQRCHCDAQPEIRALADAMRDAYDENPPCEAKAGEWHVPFLDTENINHPELLKIATGRCARVSYLNHDGDGDINADIKLHDRLLSSKPAHLSPFEHCAIAMPNSKHANFSGWQSYRKQIELLKS